MRFFKYTDKEETKKESAPSEKNKKSGMGGLSPFLAKIVCVIAAVLVWFYASGDESISYEKELTDVEVKYSMGSLTEKGYSILSGKNATVDVKITGTRRDINALTSDKVVATADLSKITKAGEYPVKVNVSIPGNITVKEVTPYELKLYIDTPTKKSFKVNVDVHNVAMGESIRIKNSVPSISEVWVTGPETELAKVAGAGVDIDFFGEKLTESVSRAGVPIKLIDKDGKELNNPYLELDEQETDVEIIVNKYVQLPVKPVYSDSRFSVKGSGYSETVDPAVINVRGEPAIIDNLKYIETTEINSADINGADYEADVKLALPSGVEIDGTVNAEKNVNVVLKRENGEKAIDISNIIFINRTEGLMYSVPEETVTVLFEGNLRDIESLTQNNVFLVADVSGITKAGTYKNVALEVNCHGSDILDNGSVDVDNKYTCTVVVEKIPEKLKDTGVSEGEEGGAVSVGSSDKANV